MSIIPSPGSPGIAPNVFATTHLSGPYAVAASAIHYLTAQGVAFDSVSTSSSLLNQGEIWVITSSAHAYVVRAYNFDAIDNQGLIVARSSAASAIAIEIQSSGGPIDNSGDIYAIGAGSASGIQTWSTMPITNSGLIAASAGNTAVGVWYVNGGELTNTSSGSILAEGAEAYGVIMREGTLTNAGRIEAVALDADSFSFGVVLESPHPSQLVVNSGVIRADIAIYSNAFTYSPPAKVGDEVINEAGGKIYGHIFLELGDDILENHGLITGNVSMAEGDDLFDNTGGQWNGYADLGWGEDTFLGSAGDEDVLGGRDSDNLNGAGGHDLLLGGYGDDVISGGAGNDGLFGEFGEDRILTLGADFVIAGGHDDRIEAGDFAFEYIDGGDGVDTLALPSGPRVLDLNQVLASERLADIEIIELDGQQGVVVRAGNVVNLTGGEAQLTVTGTATDKVDLVGAWTEGAGSIVGGISFRGFSLGAETILVQSGVVVQIAATAPGGATGLDAIAGGPLAPLPADWALSGPFTEFDYYPVTESVVIGAEEVWFTEAPRPMLDMYYYKPSLTNYGEMHAQYFGEGGGAKLIEAGAMGVLTNYGVMAAVGSSASIIQIGQHGTIHNEGVMQAIGSGPLGGALVITTYGSDSPNYGPDSPSRPMLYNSGTLLAQGDYLAFTFRAWNGGTIINEGEILAHGGESAKALQLFNPYDYRISNAGLIEATSTVDGASVGVSAEGRVTLDNSGEIRADTALSLLSSYGSTVTNTGLIEGDVILGNGADLFDSSDGSFVGTISGGDGADTLITGAGENVLIGGRGADTLDGGADGDVFVYLRTGDSTDAASDRLRNFQSGVDKIDLTAFGRVTVSWTAQTDPSDGSSYNLVSIVGEEVTLTIRVYGALALADFLIDYGISGADGADILQGTSGADRIYGEGGADLLQGLDGDDRLYGGDGDDVLDGGAGNDRLNGGDGFDFADYRNASSRIYVDFRMEGYQQGTGGGGAETWISIEGVYGTAFDDIIFGDDGNNWLDGGGGSDVMHGAAGDDTFVVTDHDAIFEEAGNGVDTVISAGSYQLKDHFENLTLTGLAAANGYGNGADNVITGNAAGNVLVGGAGADLLDGGEGADSLNGGPGVDTLIGRAGDDLLEGGVDADTLYGGAGFDTASYAGATSAVTVNLATGSVSGGAGIDSLNSIEGLQGSAHNDQLTGNDAANLLDGGAGADVLQGGLGDDTYCVDNLGDVLAEAAAGGIDTVKASINYTLGANLENLVLTGNALKGTGNDLSNLITGNWLDNTLKGGGGADTLDGGGGLDTVDYADKTAIIVADFGAGTLTIGGVSEDTLVSIEGVLAGSGNDALTGSAAANTLNGGAGDDYLKGAGGADVLDGGEGEDTADYSDKTQTVTVTLNGATAATVTVAKVAEDTLANIENLTGGSARDVLTGDDLANDLRGGGGSDALTGGGGDDLLDGGIANDVLKGGAGDDTYVIDHAGDLATEALNQGTDLVQSSVSWVLGGNFENLTLTGTGAINGTGNGLNNVITGNYRANILIGGNGDDSLYGGAGNDRLDGGSGTDTMAGGLGNDTYVVSNTLDILTELSGEGADTIEARIGWTLADNFENLTLTGINNAAGTGNSVANVILGNDANNVLSGLGGNDRLQGNGGNDTLLGGDGSDILRGGSGLDTMTGGAGGDRFLFDEAELAGLTSATCDRIVDFSSADKDRIGLTDIDANTATADLDEAFTFIGTAAFSGTAGELRYEQAGGLTLITGDTNGDGVADFMIRLDGLHTLTAGHFFL